MKHTTHTLRLILYSGEVISLPASFREVGVQSGRAWLTIGSRDIVLLRGDRRTCQAREGTAVVSPLGAEPLVLEVQGDKPFFAQLHVTPLKTLFASVSVA